MKPAFTYYGGKQRLAETIAAMIPAHKIYVEPFAGGAAVMFAKPVPAGNSHYYREVLNDHNHLLINFYRVLQNPDKRELLLERLSLTPYCQDFHTESRNLLLSDEGNDVDRAWAFFTNLQQSFSKVLFSGWAKGRISQNNAATWASRVARLPECLSRLEHVFISNIDALECIRFWDSADTFFYCDPPYVDAEQGHYGGYKQEDLDRLLTCLGEVKGKFILSGYVNASYPAEWSTVELASSASASCHTAKRSISRTEILVSNYKATPEGEGTFFQNFSSVTCWDLFGTEQHSG